MYVYTLCEIRGGKIKIDRWLFKSLNHEQEVCVVYLVYYWLFYTEPHGKTFTIKWEKVSWTKFRIRIKNTGIIKRSGKCDGNILISLYDNL